MKSALGAKLPSLKPGMPAVAPFWSLATTPGKGRVGMKRTFAQPLIVGYLPSCGVRRSLKERERRERMERPETIELIRLFWAIADPQSAKMLKSVTSEHHGLAAPRAATAGAMCNPICSKLEDDAR